MAGERLAKALREYCKRYGKVRGKKERGAVLDEFCRATGYHRKYAIGLLGQSPNRPVRPVKRRGVSYSDEALRVIEQIWEAAGCPWSARLKALLPLWLPWARKHFRGLTPELEREILAISARQLDRRLGEKKRRLKRRLYGRTKPGSLLKHHIPIKTDNWDVNQAGSCEIDLVSHSGPCASGEFIYSLNVTDIHTGWCETRAIMGKSEAGVVAALEAIRRSLPFPLTAIDSDNGSEFINHHLVRYCKKHRIQFTRGRPYKKDDNAHIEQKNWTHVRRIFGWERYDTAEVLEAMNALYRNDLRVMMNLFQPSVKLQSKQRIGSRLRRRYDSAKTPLDRLIQACQDPAPSLALQRLVLQRERLDPFTLSRRIEGHLSAIETLRKGQPNSDVIAT